MKVEYRLTEEQIKRAFSELCKRRFVEALDDAFDATKEECWEEAHKALSDAVLGIYHCDLWNGHTDLPSNFNFLWWVDENSVKDEVFGLPTRKVGWNVGIAFVGFIKTSWLNLDMLDGEVYCQKGIGLFVTSDLDWFTADWVAVDVSDEMFFNMNNFKPAVDGVNIDEVEWGYFAEEDFCIENFWRA